MLVSLLLVSAWARPTCNAEGGPGCSKLAEIAETLERPRRARRLRRKACTIVRPDACGPLWSEDEDAARAVLDQAAERCAEGLLPTCVRLARLHDRGPRALRDHAASRRLLATACDADMAFACERLGDAYLSVGPDASTDWAAAREHTDRACELGRASACHSVAWMQIRGGGGPLDVAAAYLSLESACQGGYVEACEDLGRWAQGGRGGRVDAKGAVAAWARACELRPDRCADIVATVQASGGDVAGPPLGVTTIGGCDDGYPEACAAALMLGLDDASSRAAQAGQLGPARRIACRLGDLTSCAAIGALEPAIEAQLALHRANLESARDRGLWPVTTSETAWLPEPSPLAACVDRSVKRLADPLLWGRGTPSPFYSDAADLVADAFARSGLDVRRQEVLVSGNVGPSWVMVHGEPHDAYAVNGSMPGRFRGPVAVLDGPPSPAVLRDLGDVAAVLFPARRLEPEAARRFLVTDVPVLAVTPEVAARARGAREVSGVARPPRRGERVDNVLGVLRGRGSLASEVVVLGAHLDAQSFTLFERAVSPGADDNASGVAGVVCAADALARHLADAPERRTIVFAAYAAEELGLYGSRTHMWTAPEGLVAMVNLDMIGRLGDRPVQVRAYGDEWPDLLAPSAGAVDARLADSDYEGASDHMPYALAGVPAVHLSSGLHGDYHTETDTADRIDLTGATRITTIAASTVAALSKRPPLAAPADPCREFTDEPLGVGFDLDAWDSGRDWVRCVREGSPGEALAIRPGDLLLATSGFAEWPFEPVSAFVARGDRCWSLRIGDAPRERPCESAP